MTRWLLNSAVLASGAYGTYAYSPATSEDLKQFVAGTYTSRIGYDETVAYVERMTGHRPVISRDASPLEPGDEALVIRLKYRVQDPRTKGGVRPRDEDWELAWLRRVT